MEVEIRFLADYYMSMKRVIIIVILGFFCIGQIDAYTKYPKDVRKECKKLSKEGWKTFPFLLLVLILILK